MFPATRSTRVAAVSLVVVTGVLASAGFAQSQTAAGEQSATFTSRADVVALDVSVERSTGGPGTPLSIEQFVVLEDNVPQHVTFFSPAARLPLAVVILVDRSQSMAGERLVRAREATAAFLRTLQPGDRVEILAFNDSVSRLYPLGTDYSAAEQSMDDLSAERTTALYDALLVGLRDLERARRARTDEFQNAIVIVSDGEDTRSRQTFEDVSEDARRSSTAIDTISIRTDNHNRWLPPSHEMTQLAVDTGGQAVAVRSLADLVTVYRQIGADLRQRYRLGYVPTSATPDGRWRRISVRVPNEDVIVRTRAGYYAPLTRPAISR